MADANKKKKFPTVLFFGVLLFIIIIMFIVNYKSMLVKELKAPNVGIKKLLTYEEQLIAISQDNEIYLWDWNNLDRSPQINTLEAQHVAPISADRLLWVPSTNNNILTISSLKGDKQPKRLFLETERCKLLQASPNGKYAVAALTTDSSSKNHIKLAVINPDLLSISKVLTKTLDAESQINDIAISNDGTLLAVAGQQKGSGWIFTIDTKTKKVLWEQTIVDSDKLISVIFSPDAQMIYTAKPDRYVYIFNGTTGELVKQLEMDKYKTPPNNPQTFSCITVSHNSQLLATATVPASKIWIWDAKSGRKLSVIKPGQFTVTALAFSPDSLLLASGDLIGRNPMKIWKITDSIKQ